MSVSLQEEDVTVLAAPESDPEWMLGAQITDDGRSGHRNIVAHQHTLCTIVPVTCCDSKTRVRHVTSSV